MRSHRIVQLLLLLLWVTACRSAPTTRYYVLAPSRTAPEAVTTVAETSGLRVGVEPFTVDPPYDRDQLVYRLGVDSVEVGFYSYHRWAAPLSDLVAVAMAEGLRQIAALSDPVGVATPSMVRETRALLWAPMLPAAHTPR